MKSQEKTKNKPSFFKRLKDDYDYRMKVLLCSSMAFNMAYAIFLFVVSQIYLSNWFFVMSVYYGLLSSARIFAFKQLDPNIDRTKKLKTLLTSGVFLLFIDLVVSVLMFILIYTNKYVVHHEITVITLALYTFVTLPMAIVNTVRATKEKEPVHASIRALSLTSASISLVTLTNTMLSTFGGEEVQTLRRYMLPILSGIVSVIIIVIAIIMIVKASFELKDKNEKDRQ